MTLQYFLDVVLLFLLYLSLIAYRWRYWNPTFNKWQVHYHWLTRICQYDHTYSATEWTGEKTKELKVFNSWKQLILSTIYIIWKIYVSCLQVQYAVLAPVHNPATSATSSGDTGFQDQSLSQLSPTSQHQHVITFLQPID